MKRFLVIWMVLMVISIIFACVALLGMGESTGVQQAAVNWTWLLTLVAAVLGPIFKLLSPKIRDAIRTTMLELWKKAQATDNPFDDMAVRFIFELLALEKPADMA